VGSAAVLLFEPSGRMSEAVATARCSEAGPGVVEVGERRGKYVFTNGSLQSALHPVIPSPNKRKRGRDIGNYIDAKVQTPPKFSGTARVLQPEVSTIAPLGFCYPVVVPSIGGFIGRRSCDDEPLAAGSLLRRRKFKRGRNHDP